MDTETKPTGFVSSVDHRVWTDWNILYVFRTRPQPTANWILSRDVDFTIDKKLEQDLWNNVFKSQINYFQIQIKDKKNLKRNESQANLYLFLENARGFYTKLLQDLVIKFNLDVEFCKIFNVNQIADEIDDDENNEYGRLKEKQLMYLCQHILTHLGKKKFHLGAW